MDTNEFQELVERVRQIGRDAGARYAQQFGESALLSLDPDVEERLAAAFVRRYLDRRDGSARASLSPIPGQHRTEQRF